MGLYNNNAGVLTPIAGRGKAEYGASTIRTGNVAVSIAGGGTNPMEVTFDTPMPDANYMVDCTITDQQLSKQIITVEKKTANGFILYVTNVYTNALSYNIKYTAYKLYTDNEYNNLLNNTNYSTTEENTGGTWLDGKSIYKKTVSATSPSNGTVFDTNTDIDAIIKWEGTFTNGSGSWYPLPYITSAGKMGTFNFNPNTHNISFVTNDSWANHTVYLTYYYTKTS